MARRALRDLGLLWVFLVSCSVLGSPTSQPTATTQVGTSGPVASPTATEPKVAPSPTPARFPVPRAPSHRLLLSNSDEVAQTIYAYDYETGEAKGVFMLEPEVSWHSEGDSRGLRPEYMYLSPDSEVLVVQVWGSRETPADYLEEIELATGEITSLKLSERGKWTLPLVPGREPGEDVERDHPYMADPYSNMIFFYSLVWAPDSKGFVFTLGDDSCCGPDGDQDYSAQIYYVERGSTQAAPLAAEAPEKHVGFDAAWSPRSRYVTYRTSTLASERLWLVDLHNPSQAMNVSDRITDSTVRPGWLKDETALLYGDFELVVKVDARTGERTKLVELEREGKHFVTYDLVGEIGEGGAYVVIERHSEQDQPVWGRQRVLYIDLSTDEVTPLLEGEAITHAYVLPVDELLWVVYGERREGAIVEVPSGRIVAGPAEWLYPPSRREEIESSPAWASDAFDESRLRWTPDMHLLAGYLGDDIVIWDVQTGEFTTVAPELKGYKVLLGWDPTP